MTSRELFANLTINRPLVAQAVTCYYPISDIWEPTPRYLYYALLVLSFITPSYTWLAHIFFGAAVAYAATATFEAFVLLSAQTALPPMENVTIPNINPANMSSVFESMPWLVSDSDVVGIQPDYLELDIDTITCVVITAYLVGLPLQCWSTTARSRRILHVLIGIWNLLMLAGSISVLVLWPGLNVTKPQYRFCYAGIDDGNTVVNNGWDPAYWEGSWNASVWNLFGPTLEDKERWLNYTDNCFYPCFSTSQILRGPHTLTASVLSDAAAGDNLHTWAAYDGDAFQPFIYTIIAVFTAAQLYLLWVGRLKLCSPRVPIYRPLHLWSKRTEIYRSFRDDFKTGVITVVHSIRHPRETTQRMRHAWTASHAGIPRIHKHPIFYFIIDLLTTIILIAVLILGPVTIILFIVWIERYISKDGTPREDFDAVSQWAFVVQIGVVLVAACLLRLKYNVASEDEVQDDIEIAKRHLAKLEGIAEKKRSAREGRAAQHGQPTRASRWTRWWPMFRKGKEREKANGALDSAELHPNAHTRPHQV